MYSHLGARMNFAQYVSGLTSLAADFAPVTALAVGRDKETSVRERQAPRQARRG
jgi:hypothetical protein